MNRVVFDKLIDIAEEYTPCGSVPKAVVGQWLYSVVYNTDNFASKRGISKDKIIDIIMSNGNYKSIDEFKKDFISSINLPPKDKTSFTFIDLFAGIGGMRQGFDNAGGVCVFSSEFEKNAQKTYEENYSEYPFGDITEISELDIPDHDVLIGGFPCQPFSHAGLKLGIEDTRGTLFYDIARILEEKKPKVALLENVKGLISHDKGYTLQTILKTLTKIGYKCNIDKDIIMNDNIDLLKKEAKKMVLNSRNFGVPQNRQRIFIVLWREDLEKTFEYPEPTNIKTKVGSILDKNPDDRFTISDKLWEGHQRRKRLNKQNGKGFGYGLVSEDSEYTGTISARYYKDGSEILIDQKDKNPRKLTHREAARLQGFPENFIINKSSVQAYKQFGNSVSVPVIKKLADEIVKILD